MHKRVLTSARLRSTFAPARCASTTTSTPALVTRLKLREALEKVGNDLGVTKLSDWYNITPVQVRQLNQEGAALMRQDDLLALLQNLHPEHTWIPWLFKRVPIGYWGDIKNQRAFVEWISVQEGMKSLDDWYSVNVRDLSKYCIRGLIGRHYGNSLVKLLRAVYPKHNWEAWKFKHAPRGFWKVKENRVAFFKSAGRQLGIRSLRKWYSVDKKLIIEIGGAGLLENYYDNSLVKALKDVFPLHEWHDWMFEHHPKVANEYWDSPSNRHDFIIDLANSLEITKPEEWYQVYKRDVVSHGGSGLLLRFGGHLYKVLSDVYPDGEWSPWQFNETPQSVWKDIASQTACLSDAGDQCGVLHLEDWYKVDIQALLTRPGMRSLLKYHGGLGTAALLRALQASYPDHTWSASEFERSHFPRETSLQSLKSKEMKFTSLDDWYSISKQHWQAISDQLALNLRDGSLAQSLLATYPEHDWLPWRLPAKVPNGYWDDEATHRKFFDWLAKHLGVQQYADWYKVDKAKVMNAGGVGLLSKFYNQSVYNALSSVYPSHKWYPWLFGRAPPNYWDNIEHQRHFLDWALKELGFSKLEDWYSIPSEQVIAKQGKGLLNKYGKSMDLMLRTIYPEHKWEGWRHGKSPRGYWQNQPNETIRAFMDHIGKVLKIQDLSSWYRISWRQIRSVGASHIIHDLGGLMKVLSRAYPEHSWDDRLAKAPAKRSAQLKLVQAVQSLFPSQQILEEHKHKSLVWRPKSSIELDLFLPGLSLAFELEGEQHYKDTHAAGQFSGLHENDYAKYTACLKEGITLIPIPYWWDGSAGSLAATITQARPDLLTATTTSENPIPSNEPR